MKSRTPLICLLYLSRLQTWQQKFADAEQKRVPIAYEDLRLFLKQPLVGAALLTREISVAEFDRFVDALRNEIAHEIKKKPRSDGPDRRTER